MLAPNTFSRETEREPWRQHYRQVKASTHVCLLCIPTPRLEEVGYRLSPSGSHLDDNKNHHDTDDKSTTTPTQIRGGGVPRGRLLCVAACRCMGSYFEVSRPRSYQPTQHLQQPQNRRKRENIFVELANYNKLETTVKGLRWWWQTPTRNSKHRLGDCCRCLFCSEIKSQP